MRRIVITGIGSITPFGSNTDATWKNILESKSAIKQISRFDATSLPCRIAGEIKFGENQGEFNPNDFLSTKDQKKMDMFILYGMAAAISAVEDSGWKPSDQESLDRTGVIIGSGIGGLPGIEESSIQLFQDDKKRISPFFIPSSLSLIHI